MSRCVAGSVDGHRVKYCKFNEVCNVSESQNVNKSCTYNFFFDLLRLKIIIF